MAGQPRLPFALPARWLIEQKVKTSQIQIKHVFVHGNPRTRRYLIDRELLRCQLAETLGELEEQLEEAIEALLELDVFLAVDAFIEQADEVFLSKSSWSSPVEAGLSRLLLAWGNNWSGCIQGGTGAVDVHLTLREQGRLGLNVATYAQGQGGEEMSRHSIHAPCCFSGLGACSDADCIPSARHHAKLAEGHWAFLMVMHKAYVQCPTIGKTQ